MATDRCSITSMLLYGSGMGDSNMHIHDNLPLVLRRRRRRTDPGRTSSSVSERDAAHEPILTMLEKFGVPVERIGDSTGALDMLSGV